MSFTLASIRNEKHRINQLKNKHIENGYEGLEEFDDIAKVRKKKSTPSESLITNI